MSFTALATPPWTLVPDWSEPVTETLAWLTDVLQPSRSAAGQHRALRGTPRRTLAWRAITAGPEKRLLAMALSARDGQAWHVPVWPDVQHLTAPVASGAGAIACTTLHHDFRGGGLALLLASLRSWEVVQVQSVGPASLTLAAPTTAAWPAGTRLLPLRLGRIGAGAEQQGLTESLGVRDALTAEIDEPCAWPAAWPTAATYRGWPVLEWRPNEADPLTSADPRTLGLVDNDTAPPFVVDMLGRALRAQRAQWLLHGRAQQAAWRSLLYAFAGRANPAWVPSWSADLVLAAPVSAVALQVSVQWCGYTLYGNSRAGCTDIRIELADGRALFRRITAAAEGTDTELLTLDAPLGETVAPAGVRQICFLRLCTLASDTVSIEHVTDADGTARCTLAFAEAGE